MKRFLLLILTASLLWGCYPAGPEYVEDLDVVYTTYDKTYDFTAGSTYAMPDQIVIDVKIEDGDTIYEYMKPGPATLLLETIEDNMTDLGWTRLPNIGGEADPSADLAITPAAIKSTTFFYSYWYDWWYGGWYGGYWGWYYPPYVTVSSYTTGSMIITISDPSLADDSPIGNSPTAWVAIANGLYTGTYNADRVTYAVDQAFAQSPYLKTN